MLIQLKCENCGSTLKKECDGKAFACECCGSRYVLSGRENSELIYSKIRSNWEERKKQIEQAAAERQRRNEEEKEKERCRLAEIEQRAYWIRNKLCRHCGGEFDGRLFKKCKICGKSKDY